MEIISVSVLLGLGLLTASILAVASRVFHVDEDPRVAAVLGVLPGANCGGCGFAGCEGYAKAVVSDPDIPANRCCAGGDSVAATVGELTGKVAAVSEPMRSFRRCNKRLGSVGLRYDYHGVLSCTAVAALHAGAENCSYSCLGYGDCVAHCPFNALSVYDGLVEVDCETCTGCGKCVEICPRHVLELIPARSRVEIFCSTRDRLKAVTDVCKVGCIKCGRCVKACPAGAIVMNHAKIYINQKKCLAYGDSCGQACVSTCPRKALRSMRPALLERLPEAEEKTA